jgi:hypothetical protein
VASGRPAVPERAGGRNIRFLQWASGGLWIGSWMIIVQEITRWHHMNWKLRFTPPQPPPGFHVQAHAGLPVISACVCACVAPAVFLAAAVWRSARK